MFPNQVTTDIWLGSILYLIGTIGCAVAITSVCLIDYGAVRKGSGLDTVVQKIVAAFITVGGFMVIGYATWNWEYNTAFGVPDNHR
jgi:ammonium transporter, Amt family